MGDCFSISEPYESTKSSIKMVGSWYLAGVSLLKSGLLSCLGSCIPVLCVFEAESLLLRRAKAGALE